MSPSPATDLRVLVVTHFFPSHGGGIERVAERLVQGYLEAGSRVRWIASDTDVPPAPTSRFEPIAASTWNGLERIVGLPCPLWSWSAVRRLWQEVRRADAIHVHEHVYFGSLLAVVIAKWIGRRVVLTQHVGGLPFPSPFVEALYAKATRVVARRVMKRVASVVFISDSTRAFFESAVPEDGNVHTVFNGVDSERFRVVDCEERRVIRSKLGIPPQHPMLLFVGRFVQKKGLVLLEQLARAMPNRTWVFAGRGAIDPREWQLPNVRVLGQLDEHALVDAYAAADLLILPSRGEGFPLVVQEALSCGLPVLTTEETAAGCRAVRSLLSVVSSDHLEDWITAVERLLSAGTGTSTTDRQSLATRASKQWSWTRSVEAHHALLAMGPH